MVWHPGAMSGWENQTGGELSAVSSRGPVAAKLIPIKKRLRAPDLIPALDVWLGARHLSGLAPAGLRAGGKGQRKKPHLNWQRVCRDSSDECG